MLDWTSPEEGSFEECNGLAQDDLKDIFFSTSDLDHPASSPPVLVIAAQTLLLRCRYDGPRSQFDWFFNGTKVLTT